jgi:hypothetical protein
VAPQAQKPFLIRSPGALNILSAFSDHTTLFNMFRGPSGTGFARLEQYWFRHEFSKLESLAPSPESLPPATMAPYTPAG